MAGGRKGALALGAELRQRPIGRIYTGHCTGAKAFGIMRGVLGEKLAHMRTGGIYEL